MDTGKLLRGWYLMEPMPHWETTSLWWWPPRTSSTRWWSCCWRPGPTPTWRTWRATLLWSGQSTTKTSRWSTCYYSLMLLSDFQLHFLFYILLVWIKLQLFSLQEYFFQFKVNHELKYAFSNDWLCNFDKPVNWIRCWLDAKVLHRFLFGFVYFVCSQSQQVKKKNYSTRER